jgi:hypothetical protein
MAENGYFSHYSPDGVSPWHWFGEAGYVYTYAGENLAIHFNDSTEVVEAWMDSPTHRDNIINLLYKEIGVGTAKGKFDGYDTVFVVQLFGTPAQTDVEVSEEELEPVETPVSELVEINENLEVPEVDEDPQPTEQANTSTGTVLSGQELEEEKVPAPAQALAIESDQENKATDTPAVASEVTENNTFAGQDLRGFSYESKLMTDYSGLPPAELKPLTIGTAGATMTSLATKPNDLLQITYLVLATAVVVLLSLSVVIEARKLHFQQVAYGILLLVGMGGLWYAHSLLTTGAVIT